EERTHVQIEGPVPVPQRQLIEVLVNPGGRSENENRQRIELTGRTLDKGVDSLRARDVGTHGFQSEPVRGRLPRQFVSGTLFSNVIRDHPGPSLSQPPGNRTPDSARATDDQGVTAPHREQVLRASLHPFSLRILHVNALSAARPAWTKMSR